MHAPADFFHRIGLITFLQHNPDVPVSCAPYTCGSQRQSDGDRGERLGSDYRKSNSGEWRGQR